MALRSSVGLHFSTLSLGYSIMKMFKFDCFPCIQCGCLMAFLLLQWTFHPAASTRYINSGNMLTAIPTDIPKTASRIDLSHNNINSIDDYDFANFPDLQAILMGENNINTVSKLAFVNSTNLNNIQLSGNKITTVSQLAIPGLQLREISFHKNLLGTISPDSLTGFPALRSINLASTGLTQFPNLTLVGDTLEALTISDNSFPVLDPALFATMPNLLTLQMRRCQLTSLPDFTLFPSNNKVRRILLGSDNIGGSMDYSIPILKNLPSFITLSLTDSGLTAFPNFSEVKNTLRKLELSRNLITLVQADHLSGMISLEVLDLQQNLLTSFPDVISLGLHATLTKLNLKGNNLVCDDSLNWIGPAVDQNLIDSVRTIDIILL